MLLLNVLGQYLLCFPVVVFAVGYLLALGSKDFV